MAKILRRDVAVIVEALEAGLTVRLFTPRGERVFRRGDITMASRIERGALETAHLTANLDGHVWVRAENVLGLAAQARKALANKDQILAEQTASIVSFLDR